MIETAHIILGEHSRGRKIPYLIEKWTREQRFGSLEGGYDVEMWGMIPRVLNFKIYDETFTTEVSLGQITNAVYNLDTAGRAETYETLRDRVRTGSEDIAHRREKNDGENVLAVSHSLTTAFLLNLIDPKQPVRVGLLNGSVTKVTYVGGRFPILGINDMSYTENGKAHSRNSFL